MNSKETNPLFAIAKEKHTEDLADGSTDVINKSETNISTFTIGFCRGVGYAASIFQKQIENLQTQLADLKKTASC